MSDPIRCSIPDVRYYWHGDQHESESRLLYDRPSDTFVPWDAFLLTEDSEYEYQLQDALNFIPRGYFRPSDSPNVFRWWREPPLVSTDQTPLPIIESRNSADHWRYPAEFWCCGTWDMSIRPGFERSLLYYGDGRDPIGIVLRALSRAEYDQLAERCDANDSRLHCKQWRKTTMQAALTLRSQLHSDDERFEHKHRHRGELTVAFHLGQPCFHWLLSSRRFAGVVVIVDDERWGASRCAKESCSACSSLHTIRPVPAGWVYFFRDTSGRIKIGTSTVVPKRFGNLQTGNADRLTMIAKIPGGKAVETMLHKQFKADRIDDGGEWFRPSSDLLAMIKQLKGGN